MRHVNLEKFADGVIRTGKQSIAESSRKYR